MKILPTETCCPQPNIDPGIFMRPPKGPDIDPGINLRLPPEFENPDPGIIFPQDSCRPCPPCPRDHRMPPTLFDNWPNFPPRPEPLPIFPPRPEPLPDCTPRPIPLYRDGTSPFIA